MDGFTPPGKHDQCVTRIDELMAFYTRQVKGVGEPEETTLVDLLADLMHWASTKLPDDAEADSTERVNFHHCVERATDHYLNEV